MPESRAWEGSDSPKWPLRLRDLCRNLGPVGRDGQYEEVHVEVWRILRSALSIYIKCHCRRLGTVSAEDAEDLAAEKALDLLRRIVLGDSDLSGSAPGEIASFVSKTARNGLLDLLKKRRRIVEPRDNGRPERDHGGETGLVSTMAVTVPPDAAVQRKEFARTLVACTEKLAPQARLVWLFRVFYSMATKDIAVHPEVCLKAGHVDVVLQRARQAVRDCMRRGGFDPEDVLPGTFTELWRAFRMERMRAPDGSAREVTS